MTVYVTIPENSDKNFQKLILFFRKLPDRPQETLVQCGNVVPGLA